VGGNAADIIVCAEAGASGYVTREGSLADLVTAINSAAQDELACSPKIAAALIRRVATLAAAHRDDAVGARLSRREIEIVSLIDRGLTNKEIAGRLFIALATVKNHVHNVLDKLDVQGRDEAAAWIRRQRPGDLSRPADGIARRSPTGSGKR
jgi:DNA-binding NarL/FixJ family response regulator